jgi:hypothetical protein
VLAAQYVGSPQILDEIVDRGERKQIQQISRRWDELDQQASRQGAEAAEKAVDRFLALLTAQQRTTLSTKLWQLAHPASADESSDDHEGDDRPAIDPLDWSLSFLLGRDEDCRFADPDVLLGSVAPYLSDPAVRKQLALTAEQEKRRQSIETQFRATIKACQAEREKVSPDRRDPWSMEPKIRMAKADAEKSFLSDVTPRQLEIVREAAMRKQADILLCAPWVPRMIAATKQQQADLARIKVELLKESSRVALETHDKKLQVLTPAQRQRLRELIDGKDW